MAIGFLFIAVMFAVIAGYVGEKKGRMGLGIALCFLLGVIGLIVIA
jgi:hypothetical protein